MCDYTMLDGTESDDWQYQCFFEAKSLLKRFHGGVTFLDGMTFTLYSRPQDTLLQMQLTPDQNHIFLSDILSKNTAQNQKFTVIILVHAILHILYKLYDESDVKSKQRIIARMAAYDSALDELYQFASLYNIPVCSDENKINQLV